MAAALRTGSWHFCVRLAKRRRDNNVVWTAEKWLFVCRHEVSAEEVVVELQGIAIGHACGGVYRPKFWARSGKAAITVDHAGPEELQTISRKSHGDACKGRRNGVSKAGLGKAG